MCVNFFVVSPLCSEKLFSVCSSLSKMNSSKFQSNLDAGKIELGRPMAL